MAVYKCKMCGGTIEVTEGQKVVTCEFCGTTQTVHSFDNEKKTTFFKRAEALRFKCEFDKAAGVYETIVSEFPREAEAYWGLVLCKYGIEYVDDPKTGKKIPTCHRTQFASIYEDADYLNVLKYADVVAKSIYEKEAKEISKLQKSILDISSKEDPFDIFICYKENDNNGERTKDSVLAQNIYKELHREGYRIFFARITLEDKLGTQYEPYIFAALHSAKVMLHVTMSADHSESVWVRNEWSRFLSLIAEGQQKVLIPCYKDISAYDLPEEMQSLQGQDMSKVGAMQDLVYGIEKIFRKKTVVSDKKEAVEKPVSGGSYQGLLKKGYTYLRNGRFDDADSTFDAAIKISEMPGEAYLGKVLAEYQFKTVDEVLETADEVVVDSDNFVMAKEFADEDTTKLLKKIEDTLRYNRLKENYDSAMSQYNKGDLENLSLAKDNFIALEDFEDSKEMVKECTYQMGVVYMSYITNIKSLGYCNDAVGCFEEVIDYKDSKEKINAVGALKEKITSEYKELCISKLSIAYPKTVDYDSLAEVSKRIKGNRAIVFTPNYEEFDSAKKTIEDEAIKFFISKCPAYIQSINQLNDCEKLDRLCSSIEINNSLKSIHELISLREKELKEIAVALRKKKNKKRLKITGIVCAALAVSVATFFGIKAIVDETNRNNTYNAAASYMESGNYDDAIAYYQTLGNYKEAQTKIQVCEGLKQLESSIESKKEEDAIKGIKTIISAGEKVDVSYETENNVNIKRLAGGGNSGNKTETIETLDFTFYQPVWGGYTFLNWNSNNLFYKDNRTHLGLMSNWSLNSYTISYTLNGGTNNPNNPTVYNVEMGTVRISNPSKTGYTFTGWNSELGDNQIEPLIPNGHYGDLSFTATWTANKYQLHLNPNKGIVDPLVIDVFYDSNFILPTPTRDGCVFDGWYYEGTSTKATSGIWNFLEDKTVVAEWILNSYSISYVLNGGVNDSSNPAVFNVESGEIIIANPTRTGYTFTGWNSALGNNQIEPHIPSGYSENLTFTATWAANKYNLYLDANKGNVQPSVLEVYYDSAFELPTPTRDGCTFDGWHYKDTSDSAVSGIWIFTEDKTVVADWTLNPYSISYVLNGGTNNPSNPTSFNVETGLILISEPTRDGYTFTGWNSELGNGQMAPQIPEGYFGDITFTATWTANLNTIVFNGNGSTSGNTESITGYTDSTITLPKNMFVRENCTFVGWTFESDNFEINSDFSDEGSYTVGTNQVQVLYAKWVPNFNIVSFNGNGSTSPWPMEDQLFENDSTNININSYYSKVGYDFVGWSYEPDGEAVYEDGDIYKMNLDIYVTLYAVWEPSKYYLYLDPNGGQCSDEHVVVTYDSLYSLPVPTKPGYDFLGWYYEDVQMTLADGSSINAYTIDSVVTFSAHWTAKNNTIKLLLDDPVTVNGYTDTYIRLPDIGVTENKYILGWSSSENATDIEWSNGDLYYVGTDDEQSLYPVYVDLSNFTAISSVSQFNIMDKNKNYYLTKDLDFGGDRINSKDFNGILVGCGHSIHNFILCYVTLTGAYGQIGLFNTNNGTIRDLNIFDVTIELGGSPTFEGKQSAAYPADQPSDAYLYFGVVAARNNGTIQNCSVSYNGGTVNATVKRSYRGGGLTGINAGLIKDCAVTLTGSFTGSLYAAYNYSYQYKAFGNFAFGGFSCICEEGALIDSCLIYKQNFSVDVPGSSYYFVSDGSGSRYEFDTQQSRYDNEIVSGTEANLNECAANLDDYNKPFILYHVQDKIYIQRVGSHEFVKPLPLNTDYASYTFNGWTNSDKSIVFGKDDLISIPLGMNYLSLYVSYEEPEYTY